MTGQATGNRGPRAGAVIWITGLPGAGKTTISQEVLRLLKTRTPAVVGLDGDAFRVAMENDLGYSMAERLQNARRLSRMCLLLSSQGLHVVCATVSLFRECHDWNRTQFPHYVEVLVRTSEATRLRRDLKGLITDAAAGRTSGVVGSDQEYHEPEAPDIIVENEDGVKVEELAHRIVARAETTYGHLG